RFSILFHTQSAGGIRLRVNVYNKYLLIFIGQRYRQVYHCCRLAYATFLIKNGYYFAHRPHPFYLNCTKVHEYYKDKRRCCSTWNIFVLFYVEHFCFVLRGTFLFCSTWNIFVLFYVEHFCFVLRGTFLFCSTWNIFVLFYVEHFCFVLRGTFLFCSTWNIFVLFYVEHFCFVLYLLFLFCSMFNIFVIKNNVISLVL